MFRQHHSFPGKTSNLLLLYSVQPSVPLKKLFSGGTQFQLGRALLELRHASEGSSSCSVSGFWLWSFTLVRDCSTALSGVVRLARSRQNSLWVSADALLPILIVLTEVNLRTADPFLVSFIFVTFDLLLLLDERVKRVSDILAQN